MKSFCRAARLGALALWLYAGNAAAWDTSRLSAQELRALPAYCQVHIWIYGGEPVPAMPGRTLEQTKAEFENWKKRLGWDGYMHTHHYCWGLGKLNRYYRHGFDKDRDTYLEMAVSDVNYTLAKAPANYALLPDMLIFRGKVYEMLNQPTAAVDDFQKAIKLNPKYEKAYIGLADIYKKHGQADVSGMIIQQGLKVIPNSKILAKHSTPPSAGNKPPAPGKQH